LFNFAFFKYGITNNIDNGGFTTCIAVDPRDADKVLVVYANYEVYSLYYTIDGGNYWMKVGGNLEKGPVNGVPTAFRRIDPIVPDTNQGGNYLFINPFILDPSDNNIMYLCEMYKLWRNDDLDAIPLTNEFDTISQGWTELTNTAPISNSYITTIACSKNNPSHRVYYGANKSTKIIIKLRNLLKKRS